MFYDLHTHTNKSDGKYSRFDLLKKANDLHMKYLSFTDHDYLDKENVKKEYEQIYGNCEVELIDGIEFTIEDYKNMHILGYGIKDKDLIIHKLEQIKDENVNICKRLIYNLNSYYGFDLNLNDYSNYNLSKGLIRQMLVDKNIVENLKIAGDLYTGINSKFYEKTRALKIWQVISLIKLSKGISVLAHPSVLKLENNELDLLIKKLRDIGLEGIEILNQSKTTQVQAEYYEYLAKKYDLLMSCGSDFHNKKNTPIFGVDNEKSKKLIRKIKEM